MQAVGREEKLDSIYFEIAAKFPPWEGRRKLAGRVLRKKRGIPGFFPRTCRLFSCGRRAEKRAEDILRPSGACAILLREHKKGSETMVSAGLIIEGGGMRGVYSAGILDFFLDQNLEFSSVYGVSAGACHACSYLSRQRGRAFAVNVDYLEDKHYCSVYSWLTTGNMLGVEMLYDKIPNQLNLYDYDAFEKSKSKFYAVATNCQTGEAAYLPVTHMRRDIRKVQASSSLPVLAKMVEIDGRLYMDGGMADSIPLRKSIQDGNRKNVVLLTQHDGYTKEPNKAMGIIRMVYRKYPKLVEATATRHIRYNQALKFVAEEQKKGTAFVIRPKHPVHVGRLEKNRKKLQMLYEEGYADAKSCWPELQAFLQEEKA